MSLRSMTSGSKRISQLYATLVYQYWTPTLRFALFQAFTITFVSLFLGVVVFVATADTLLGMVVMLMGALGPFILIIATKLFGSMKRLFVVLILLEIPVGFDINFGFNETISAANSVSGFNVSITTLCLIFLYVWWLAEVATGETTLTPTHFLRAERPILAYLLAAALSLLVTTSIVQSLVELNLLIQGILLFVYLVYAIRTRNDLLTIAFCIVIGLVFQSLIIIALHFVGATIELGPISFTVWKNSRIAGTLGTPNGAGSYLVFALLVSLSLTITPIRWPGKALAWMAFGLGVVALLLTLSRGAWIGFALGVALFWLLAGSRGWVSPLLPLIAIVCAIPIAIYFREMLIARLFGDDGGSAESRVTLMKLALRMIRDHWLLGVGANNFAFHLQKYVTPEMSLDWLTTVHNKYLLVWAETGIIGLVTFVWFLLTMLKRGWLAWQKADRFIAPLGLGFTLALVGWIAHMNFDLFNGRPQVQLLLVMGALITVTYNMSLDSAHG